MNWKWSALPLCFALGLVTIHRLKSTSEYQVDGRHFQIPRDRIFNARIPWLPAPSQSSFTYILDFAADPNLIPPHRILVQSRHDVCGRGQAQMITVACGDEVAAISSFLNFRKSYPIPNYPMEWDYYASAPATASRSESDGIQVASCSPISPNPARAKGTAICTTVWNVDGLVLTLGFEEHELPEIGAMRNRAAAMLLSWKVRSP
ncbi:hypothetical protein EOE18_17800 [Novosphingobium umbonatum]|uniref:Uncharacterized protein n=1 Tax=Novosphingobium umbonatum TaxID=1908524 RepID=A0A3S2Y508_9SPHN|nr:hypothetical protein [Novosphingobium umbonatum]RVU02190.1 hypothetical protein EOE18_17800 [Novosphingobium umbonatum]